MEASFFDVWSEAITVFEGHATAGGDGLTSNDDDAEEESMSRLIVGVGVVGSVGVVPSEGGSVVVTHPPPARRDHEHLIPVVASDEDSSGDEDESADNDDPADRPSSSSDDDDAGEGSRHCEDEAEFRRVELDRRESLRQTRRTADRGSTSSSSDAPSEPAESVSPKQGATLLRRLYSPITSFPKLGGSWDRVTTVSAPGSETSLSNDLFLSHCWRCKDTQLTKRQLVAALNEEKYQEKRDGADNSAQPDGFTYWGDFLDLQQDGPVAWRKEIEDGIATAAKFVAYIDSHYLHSFNCIQELAYAFHYGKPIVPIILDHGAWEILTSINGAEQAYNGVLHDAAGHPLPTLGEREGQPIMEGQPLTLDWLVNMFSKLSSINFCPCREADFLNFGYDGMMQMMLKFVRKDITYLKEHNELQRRTDQWAVRTGASKTSALLSGKDIRIWSDWINSATKYENSPPPSKTQREFVKKSQQYSTMKARVLGGSATVAIIVIICLAVWAGVAAKQAIAAKAVANEQRAIAEENEALALKAEARATMMLLLQSSAGLESPAQARAAAKAIHMAAAAGEEQLVLPQLFDMLASMQERPFWMATELAGHPGAASLQSVAWSSPGPAPDRPALLACAFMLHHEAGPRVGVWFDPMSSPELFSSLPSANVTTGVVRSLAWAPPSLGKEHQSLLASAHDDGTVVFWSVSQLFGELSRLDSHLTLPDAGQEANRMLSWSPGGQPYLAVGSAASNSVRVYAYPSLALLHQLSHFNTTVLSVSFSPQSPSNDKAFLAVGLENSDVGVWDTSLMLDQALPGSDPTAHQRQALSDQTSPAALFSLTGQLAARAYSLAWVVIDRDFLLSVGSHVSDSGQNNSIAVWRLQSNGTEPPVLHSSMQRSARVTSLAWSPADDAAVLAASFSDGALYAWPAPEQLLVDDAAYKIGTDQPGAELGSVAFSQDGVLASGGHGLSTSEGGAGPTATRLWLTSPVIDRITEVVTLEPPSDTSGMFPRKNAQGAWGRKDSSSRVAAYVNVLSSSTWSFEGCVSVWERTPGSLGQLQLVHQWYMPSYLQSLAFGGGPEGDLLALSGKAGSLDRIIVYSVGSSLMMEERHNILVPELVTSLAWAPTCCDGPDPVPDMLASGSNLGEVRVWRVADGAANATSILLATHAPGPNAPTGSTAVEIVTWGPTRPDGRLLLASGCKDGSVKVIVAWLSPDDHAIEAVLDLQPPAAIKTGMPVHGLSWSSEGELAVSVGTGTSGSVWTWHHVDAPGEVGVELLQFDVPAMGVAWAPASGDSRLIVGLADGSVRVHNTEDLLSSVWVLSVDGQATSAAANSVGWSADGGSSILAVHSDGHARVAAADFSSLADAFNTLVVGELTLEDLYQLGIQFVAPTLGLSDAE